MKNKFRKWSAWLCGIVSAVCLGGAGVALATASETTGVVASAAETKTWEITAIRAEAGNATAVHIAEKDHDASYWGEEEDWTNVYSFVANSGVGLTLNGKRLTTTDIKQPGALYVGLGVTAQAGDVLIIDGTYSNETTGKVFKFKSCGLKFNGTTWESCTAISMGSTTLQGGDANTVSFATQNVGTSGKQATSASGLGVQVNGYNVGYTLTTTESGVQVTLATAMRTADVLHISGAFQSGDEYYSVLEAYAMWNGSAWSTLSGYYEIITRISSTYKNENVDSANGFHIPIENNSGIGWDALALINGQGLKLNGVELKNAAIKLVGASLFVDLGTTAKENDILTINGLYQHTGTGYKILFVPTQVLQYKNGVWVDMDANGGTTYDLDKLAVASPSANPGQHANNAQLYLTREDNGWLPIQSWDVAFTYESGAGVKLNGQALSSYELKSTDAGVFMSFNGVSVGDNITIGGTFYCAANQTRYVIEESAFTWNGEVWAAGYREIQRIEVLEPHPGSAQNNASTLYLMQGVANLTQMADWAAFTLESGEGIKLNGEPCVGAVLKKAGSDIYVEFAGAVGNDGDILTIDGDFLYKSGNVVSELIFVEAQTYVLTNNKWVRSTVVLHELGEMKLAADSTNGGGGTRHDHLYITRADGGEMPVQSWDYRFVLEKGEGLKVNGVSRDILDMKSPGGNLWLAFDGVERYDEVSIEGIFFCEDLNVRYVVDESKFVWNGSTWEAYVNYTVYNVGTLNSTKDSNATEAYLSRTDGGSFNVTWDGWGYSFNFLEGTGVGITLDGQQIGVNNNDLKVPGTIYVGFGKTAVKGSVLVVSGTFYNKELKVKYVVEESVFEFNGTKWVKEYTDDELAIYDTVSPVDLGGELSNTFNGTGLDFSGLTYVKSEGNTTGSLKFRFIYNSANTSADAISIRLHDNDVWANTVHFRIIWGGIEYVDQGKVFEFANGVDYEIELGAINLKGSTSVWTYIKVDGVIVEAKTIANVANAGGKVSVYFGSANDTVIKDPDYVAVNYEGSDAQLLQKGGELTLLSATNNLFVGWVVNGEIYQAGETIVIGESAMTISAFEMDFTMKYGAAIRLAGTVEESGIRFTSMINEGDLNALQAYGLGVSFGTLIMPNDYLGAGQAPNLTDFVAGSTVLKIVSTIEEGTERWEVENGYVIYRGAMNQIKTKNYGREFAGRGYMEITFANGVVRTIYTNFSADNVRSVKWVASAVINDTEAYEKLSDAKKEIVHGYADSADYGAKARASVAQMEENYAAAFVVGGKKESV